MSSGLQRFVLTALFFAFVGAGTLTGQTAPSGDQLLGQWTAFTAMPSDRINHCTVMLDGIAYVIGGTSGIDPANQTFKYDIAADAWSTGFDLPVARNFAVAEAVNGKIYVIGGYQQLSPLQIVAQVLEYDPGTGTLDIKADIPTPVAGAASVVIGGRIYVLGGSGSGGYNVDYKDLVQVFDPSANSWEQATVLPFAARSLGAAVVGNTIIAAGGYNNKSAPAIKRAAYKGEVSGTTITWTALPDYPETDGINRVSTGATADKVYFCSGQTNRSVTAKTYALDPTAGDWEQQGDKPNAVHSSGRMVYDGSNRLFVFGGQTASSQSALNEALGTITAPSLSFNGKPISTKIQTGSEKKFGWKIANPGSATLTWDIAVDPPSTDWLSISKTSGSLLPETADDITLALSARTAGAGDYAATVTLTSNDPSRPTTAIAINIHVQNEPVYTGKRVLLEEFTGTWCGWCPYGVDSIHAILARYPDEVVVASYHNGDAMTLLTSNEEKVLHVAYFPGGLVDRMYFPGEADTMIDRGTWGQYIDARLGETAPVQVAFTNKKYNPGTRQTTLTVNVTFTEEVQPPLRINLIQTETGQNYRQVIYNQPYTSIYPYTHEHVVRLILPDLFGDVIADAAPIASGTVWTQDYAFISADSVADNCELVAIVHRGTATSTGEVLQSYAEGFADRMLTAYEPPVSNSFELLQNYPNPFNPTTTISYSVPLRALVRIAIYNSLGMRVATVLDEIRDPGTYALRWNAAGVPSGTYLIRLESGGQVSTRAMTVLK